MPTSEKQLTANRANALKSTGPRTIEGKSASSENAIRHGLFSQRVLVDGEHVEDFDCLVADLQNSLNPTGALELALCEKIALNMWRQRRLAMAEAAGLRLERRPRPVARNVSTELGRGFSTDIGEKDLVPFDPKREEWCRGVIDEYDAMDQIDLGTLPKQAPQIFSQLERVAEEDGESIEEHLAEYEHGLTGYVGYLVHWCHKQLQEAEKRPALLAVAEQVRARSLILPRAYLELFARYQTTLDNQLFRTLRALRDAQEWRFKTIDCEPVSDVAPEVEK